MPYFENINFTVFLAWVLALQKAAKVQRINGHYSHPQGRRYLVTKSLEMKWNDCMNLKFGPFAMWHWPLRNDLESRSKWSERPKGPHIVHLSTMCHLFDRLAGAAIFIFFGLNNTNMERCWGLASCQVSLNSVQQFQRRSLKCLSLSNPRAAILFFRSD